MKQNKIYVLYFPESQDEKANVKTFLNKPKQVCELLLREMIHSRGENRQTSLAQLATLSQDVKRVVGYYNAYFDLQVVLTEIDLNVKA